MTTPNETEVIADLRGWYDEGAETLFTWDDTLCVDIADILAAYDAIVAERDAAVRQHRDSTDQAHRYAQLWEASAQEVASLRARLAACERDLNYIRRVTVGAVESDKLAATCKTIGEYRYVLLKAINAMDIAVAAETQGEKDA